MYTSFTWTCSSLSVRPAEESAAGGDAASAAVRQPWTPSNGELSRELLSARRSCLYMTFSLDECNKLWNLSQQIISMSKWTNTFLCGWMRPMTSNIFHYIEHQSLTHSITLSPFKVTFINYKMIMLLLVYCLRLKSMKIRIDFQL